MADGNVAKILDERQDVLVAVGGITHPLTLIFVKEAPFGLIIGRPAKKMIEVSLHFGNGTTAFRLGASS